MHGGVIETEYTFCFTDQVLKIVDTERKSVFYAENETGNGTMTMYTVMNGITVLYDDFHMYDCSSLCIPKPSPNIVEFNHCREGRFECEYEDSFCYIGEGDFVSVSKETVSTSSCFPLSHYHGISIILDFDIVKRNKSFFEEFGIDVQYLSEILCGQGRKFMFRRNASVEHIFSELYTVHDSARSGYLKLKVLELLLFLSIPGVLSGKETQKLYSCIRIRRIKEIKKFICDNSENCYTLEDLSGKFGISLTALKQGFKAVYGKSPASFAREFRMQKAAKLLRTTDDTVLTIALRVGYDNPSKFASAFHTVMNCNPAEYRKIPV